MTPRAWNTAVSTGLLRLVIGAVLLRWRGPLARRIAGAAPDDRLLPLLFGYFGLRDITVGVVTLAATRPDGDVRRAVTVQGVADSADAVLLAGLTARGRLTRPRGVAMVALAGVTAAGEFVTARGLAGDGGGS